MVESNDGMDCEEIPEYLPWLLNGSLDTDTEQAVRGHLGQCPACRDELARTERAWALLQAHLPTDALVEHVFAGAAPEGARAVVEAHLRGCPQCRDELALVHRSQALLAETADDEVRADARVDPARSDRGARAPAWRWAALTAGLAALVSGAAWYWSGQRGAVELTRSREREQSLRARLTDAEAENRRLREPVTAPDLPPERGTGEENSLVLARREIIQLREQLATLAAPRLNVAVFELLPSLTAQGLRATAEPGGEVNPLALAASTPEITLLLLTEPGARRDPATLELTDGRGDVVWRASGLVALADGHYALTLPAGLLADGNASLRLIDEAAPERELIAQYRVRVTRADR